MTVDKTCFISPGRRQRDEEKHGSQAKEVAMQSMVLPSSSFSKGYHLSVSYRGKENL
jgi:hypothetical protein